MLKAAILLIALSLATFAHDVFKWDIPQPFPHPAVPAGNSMSASKVELGPLELRRDFGAPKLYRSSRNYWWSTTAMSRRIRS